MTALRQRMIEDMQVRNLAPHTQTTYLKEVSRFARYFGTSPQLLGEKELRAFGSSFFHDRPHRTRGFFVSAISRRLLRTRKRPPDDPA